MIHFDTLETRDPELRRKQQLASLRGQFAHAKANAPAFAQRLAAVDPDAITSLDALAQLPVTRKSELADLQRASKPFGGLAATRYGEARRVFQSPGPLYEPEGARPDYWRLARAMFAAGFRRGDLVHNCFSYHLTPAGSMVECGAHALGCTVFPGGTGQTELQVQAMDDLRPNGYVGTPSFLKIILEKADEQGVHLPTLTKALVSGEAFPPSLRDALKARGIDGYQAYATADLGCIAYETPAREGLVIDEGVLVEIVRPGTGDPVAPGEVGEVVVTTLFNTDYPLVRFGTGDLSAMLAGSVSVRAHERADQGLDGARRPDDQGQGHVRARVAGRGDREAPPRSGAGAPRRRQPRRQRPDDAAGRGRGQRVVARRVDRRVDPRGHEAPRRSRIPRTPASCPTTAR